MLDSHKAVMDSTTGFLNDAHKVFCTTHDVDYDQEGKNLFCLFLIHAALRCTLITLSSSSTHKKLLLKYEIYTGFFLHFCLKHCFATG